MGGIMLLCCFFLHSYHKHTRTENRCYCLSNWRKANLKLLGPDLASGLRPRHPWEQTAAFLFGSLCSHLSLSSHPHLNLNRKLHRKQLQKCLRVYLVCQWCVQQVPSLCVDDPFRFPRTSRGVEEKEQVFTVQRFCSTHGRLTTHHLKYTLYVRLLLWNEEFPASGFTSHLLQGDIHLSHRALFLCPLRNKDVAYGGATLDSGIHGGLQWDEAAPPHTLITGDHSLTLSCNTREGLILPTRLNANTNMLLTQKYTHFIWNQLQRLNN